MLLPPKGNIEIIRAIINDTSKINLNHSKDSNIVVCLGETGSGISTLVHLIAKDNQILKSIETGAGEYLLVDEDGKISKNTTISETIIPESIEDIHTKTIFYDCPGFNNTRSTAADISNAFLINKIINYGSALKIILIINYHSVRNGMDKRSFIELLRNVTNIIKDIDKYKNSIAAVITKVENIYRIEENIPKLVPDNEVLKSIVSCLQKIKQEIPKDRQYYQNAMKLIDVLLSENHGTYQRLSIFRRPDRAGYVSDIAILQNTKHTIQKLITDNIVFTKKSIYDFGYTISTESKKEIFDVVTEINEKIINIMKEIGKTLLDVCVNRENDTSDLNVQIIQFHQIWDNILNIKKSMTSENMTLENVLYVLAPLLNNMDLALSEDFLQNLFGYDQQLRFLTKVSDNNLNIKQLEWINGLDNFSHYVNDSIEWYKHLSDICTRLSKYELRKNINTFDSYDINSLKNSSDFVKIIEFIYNNEIENGHVPRCLNIIKNQENKIKLSKLREILAYALDTDMKCITTDPIKDQIMGKYVIISDIPSDILLSDKKYIEIFAINSVFIDKDLNFEGRMEKLVIVSPEWHIIDKRIINLNGENGLAHEKIKANNGMVPGSSGDDGQPGTPGGAAGILLGIGEKFFNLKSLTVTANGGDGSDGQSGGNGVAGENGIDPQLPDESVDDVNVIMTYERQGFNCIFHSDADTSAACSIVLPPTSVKVFEIIGTNGQPGGNGGAGGYHGQGGKCGQINIIDVKNESKRLIYDTIDGKNGQNGNEGIGGAGGINGKRIYAKYVTNRIDQSNVAPLVADAALIALLTKGVVRKSNLMQVLSRATTTLYPDKAVPKKWSIHGELSQGKQNDGEKGAECKNNKIKDTERDNSVQLDTIPIIQQYKRYLKENGNNYFMKHILLEYVKELDEDVISSLVN